LIVSQNRNGDIGEQNTEDDDPDKENIERDDDKEENTADGLLEFVKSQSSSFPACYQNALQQLKRLRLDKL
jgi:hypothetical protein